MSFLKSNHTTLALFTIVGTLLAIPLVVLVSQEKQTLQQHASATPKEEVEGAMTVTMSGYAYIDANANSQRDPEEKPYPNASVRVAAKVNNAVQMRDVRTDSYGYFLYKFENQTLGAQVKLMLPDGYKTTTQNPVTLTNQKQTIEFGIFNAVPITPQLSCMPRPACLDSVPRCLVAEPSSGWCPAPSYKPQMEYRKPTSR